MSEAPDTNNGTLQTACPKCRRPMVLPLPPGLDVADAEKLPPPPPPPPPLGSLLAHQRPDQVTQLAFLSYENYSQ